MGSNFHLHARLALKCPSRVDQFRYSSIIMSDTSSEQCSLFWSVSSLIRSTTGRRRVIFHVHSCYREVHGKNELVREDWLTSTLRLLFIVVWIYGCCVPCGWLFVAFVLVSLLMIRYNRKTCNALCWVRVWNWRREYMGKWVLIAIQCLVTSSKVWCAFTSLMNGEIKDRWYLLLCFQEVDKIVHQKSDRRIHKNWNQITDTEWQSFISGFGICHQCRCCARRFLLLKGVTSCVGNTDTVLWRLCFAVLVIEEICTNRGRFSYQQSKLEWYLGRLVQGVFRSYPVTEIISNALWFGHTF